MTLSINIKFLDALKQGFRRSISWEKYRSEIRAGPRNNNLNCMIDPTFMNISRLFLLSFQNGDDDLTRNSFDEHYVSLVAIQGINGPGDNKPPFQEPVKDKHEVYEKLIEMSKNTALA